MSIPDKAMKLKDGKILYDDLRGRIEALPDPTDIIDDTAGDGDTDKVFSADKLTSELSDVKSAIETKQDIVFVTPEMFGAKGDGETDDSEAIQDMFDSEYNTFFFGNKTYLVEHSIDVEKACDINFNNTILKANGNRYAMDHSYEYVISFKATHIYTYGELYIKCETSVNIGIWLESCGNSEFDSLRVANARIWGIYSNPQPEELNGMIFHSINVAQCGYKVYAKAKYATNRTLTLSDFSCSTPFYSYVKTGLFGNEYRHSEIIIDDSGYTERDLWNRYVFGNNGTIENIFDLDENITSGTFTAGNVVYSDYSDGESGRRVFIPIGGGINLQPRTSEGTFNIHKLVTQSNPIGARIFMGYGGNIGVLVSEYNAITLHTNSINMNINYLYVEAGGTYYSNKFNNGYDTIVCLSYLSTVHVYVNSVIGISGEQGFKQGNSVTLGRQFQYYYQDNYNAIEKPTYLADKIQGMNVIARDMNYRTDVDENTPRNITIDSNGYNSTYTIRIGLINTNAFTINRFEPMNIYVRRRSTTAGVGDSFAITLTDALIADGYLIDGATNNILTITPSDYNSHLKITIVLFRETKTFFVSAEPLNFVPGTVFTPSQNLLPQSKGNLVTSLSNASTDTQYPSAKCIYDIVGNVATLLAAL